MASCVWYCCTGIGKAVVSDVATDDADCRGNRGAMHQNGECLDVKTVGIGALQHLDSTGVCQYI